jgi:hypothetical protein
MNTRRVIVTFIVFFIFMAGCSNSDPVLQKMARETYTKRTWEEPLPPNDFRSDGCSCWPDSDWVECCVEHDADYWLGGTSKQRKEADKALERCVAAKGHPVVGWMMYWGVRAGGVYWLPTSFRWGFGWEFPRSGPPGVEY